MALVEARGVKKSYPGARALDGVDLSVDGGEVHALLGENGAGKSTLMKVIAGSVLPDAGSLEVAGSHVPLGSPEAGRAHGVGIVYQELSLVPSLTVAENVLLGRWPTRSLGLIDWDSTMSRAEQQVRRVGLDVDVRRKVRGLGMAERQMVEIAKALSQEVKVLLLDEPTSALSEREAGRLFEIVRDLKTSGVGIVYVSHRLNEVLEIADRITVLRDGRRIETVAAGDTSESELARMMVGRELDTRRPQIAADHGTERTEVALRATGLGRPPRLKPVDLELRGGEILGVFGLVGAGRTRLARMLFGLEPATEGSLEIAGNPVRIASPADAIAAGMGYLGEDRSAGVVPRMNVAGNITLASLSHMGRGPVLDSERERETAQRYVGELGIRISSLEQLLETLSGGNQQKVVLARWLCSNARILVLDDPTRGIDVGAKEEVFKLVRRLSEQGIAILYLTSEIKEARTLADRILVMSGGKVVASVDPGAEEDQIMARAGGARG